MAIKKVIIPVDGSGASENAFHAGIELAGKYGAEILLLNVVYNGPVVKTTFKNLLRAFRID